LLLSGAKVFAELTAAARGERQTSASPYDEPLLEETVLHFSKML